MSFDTFLSLIKDNDPVKAGLVNAPMRQIDQNTRYLWDVLQAAAIGSTVYARQQTVESTTKIGMAVYFDSSSQMFKRGLALADIDNTTGTITTAASSQVWGIVATKTNETLADILLFGMTKIDLSQALVDAPVAGTYYLSGVTPGYLTIQKPPVSVAVLRRTTDGTVFVQPQFIDFLDRHTHYAYDLVCQPAGTTAPPTSNARHVITNPNPLLAGWLPANHSSFNGLAPRGAVFGYNLAAHQALKATWPPVPVTNAALEWNKALSADVGFTGVPLGAAGLCILDRNGIWWLSDCYGDVPWPVDFDSTVSVGYSDSAGAECPRHIDMGMKLLFTRINFATDAAMVLSLRSTSNRIKVQCAGDATKNATTGHLEISLDLNLVVADNAPGYLAIKDFDPIATSFKRGPVASGVYSLSNNVTVAGDAETVEEVAGHTRTIQHGRIGISVDPADTKELDVELVRLDGAEEAYYGNPPIMYLEFVPNDYRQYRGKITIPYDLAVPSPLLKLRFHVLGRAAGTLPQLVFSGRRIPRPTDGLASPLVLPNDTAEFVIACPTVVAFASPNMYVEAESVPFPVTPGDTVFFTVLRRATDSYAGNVGILKQSGVVIKGT